MNHPDEFHPNPELISAWLDEALEAGERELVETHLAVCLRCQSIADDFRTLARAAAAEEAPPVPPGLAARIGLRVRAAGAGVASPDEITRPIPIIPAAGWTAGIRRALDQVAAGLGFSGGRVRPWRSRFALAAAGVAVATLVWLAVRQETPVPVSQVSRMNRPAPAPEVAPAPPSAASNDQEAGTKRDLDFRKQKIESGAREEKLRAMGSVQPAVPAEPSAPRAAVPGSEESRMEERSIAGGTAGPAPPPGDSTGVAPSDENESIRADGKDVSSAAKEAAPLAGTLSVTQRPPVDRMKKTDAPAAGYVDDSRTGDARYSPSRKPAAAAAPKQETAPEAAGGAGSAGPRTLLYETPQVTVSLSEDGSVTLVQRGYACSVNVATPAAAGQASAVPRELSSLFEQASSRLLRKSISDPSMATAPAPEAEVDRPSSIALRGPDGSPIYIVSFGEAPGTTPPPLVQDLEAEIRRAIGTHFRRNLELRCGPIPELPGTTTP